MQPPYVDLNQESVCLGPTAPKMATWCYNVRNILHGIGCSDLFDDAPVGDIAFSYSAPSEIDLMDCHISRYNSDKLRFHDLHKYIKGLEDYIKMNSDIWYISCIYIMYIYIYIYIYIRSNFAPFRCGIQALEIKVGRYQFITLENRFCWWCNNVAENEIHALCKVWEMCTVENPFYRNEWQLIYHSCVWICSSNLYSSCQIPKI